MTPITPSGTRILPTRIPLGCSRNSLISPTGSGSFATCSRPCAMLSMLFSVSVRRSMNAVLARDARPLRVIGVRGEKLAALAADRLRHSGEGAVLGTRVGAGELARCDSCPAADLEHVGLDVQRSVHERILPPGG